MATYPLKLMALTGRGNAKHMQEAKKFAIFDLHKRCRVGFAFSFHGMVPAIP